MTSRPKVPRHVGTRLQHLADQRKTYRKVGCIPEDEGTQIHLQDSLGLQKHAKGDTPLNNRKLFGLKSHVVVLHPGSSSFVCRESWRNRF